jgi:hypothetical protein
VQAYGVVETYDVLVDVAHATGTSARCRRRCRKSPTTSQACTLDASNDYEAVQACRRTLGALLRLLIDQRYVLANPFAGIRVRGRTRISPLVFRRNVITADHPAAAEELRRSSPHWTRHTHATHALAVEAPTARRLSA